MRIAASTQHMCAGLPSLAIGRTPDWELEMGDGRTVGIEVYGRSECASGCIRHCGDHTFDDEGYQSGYLFSGKLGPDSQRLRNVLHAAADRKGGPRSQLSGYDIKVLVVGLVDQRAGYEFTTCMRYPSSWGRDHLGFLNDVATEVMDFVNNMDSASNLDEIWAFRRQLADETKRCPRCWEPSRLASP